MKRYIVLIALALLASLVAGDSSASVTVDRTRQRQECMESGGRWIDLTAGCMQRCGESEPECVSGRSHGCDCGEGMCWTGGRCVSERAFFTRVTS
jgi:hypothetical protein